MSKRTDAEIIRDLQGVECGLSPENLSCDGELSKADIKRRQRSLLSQKEALIKELGRKPTSGEILEC